MQTQVMPFHITFAEQVARLRARNAAALTERALLANSLAKGLSGNARKLAYRVKASTTKQLLAMGWASVTADKAESNHTVLIRLKTSGRGLHLLRTELANAA